MIRCFLKITILCSLLACAKKGNGQLYLGLSANFGNRLSYTPSSPGLQTPPAISGSIVAVYNKALKDNWILQYGGAIGVLGYHLSVNPRDTLSTFEDDPFHFLEYSTLYGKLDLLVGKVMPVGKRKLMIGVGGGVSFYYSLFPEMSYSVGQFMDDGTEETLFSADFYFPETNLLPFTKIATQLKLNERLTLDLKYTHSFKSIVNGTYEFYHTKKPSSGSVSLYPRELSFVFMVNTSKRAYDPVKRQIREEHREGKHKTYLGFEVAVANDLYKLNDNGEYLKSVPLYNVTWGFNVRQVLSEKYFMETGFILKYYWEGFGFETIPYYFTHSTEASWLIPIRGGMNFNLLKHKIYFTPIIGYVLGFNNPFGFGFGSGTQQAENTVIEYSYVKNSIDFNFFSLLQVGGGFDFKLFKTLYVGLSANYYKGFKALSKVDIEYTVNNAVTENGSTTNMGDFWNVNLGIRYPISNFWQR